jgi:nucleotide-binding universal stress UspA family protein
LSGARLHLLSVVLPSDPPSVPPVAAPAEDHRQRWLAYLEQHAETLRREGADEVAVDVRSGDDPAATIAAFAEEVDSGLIVMSTQGNGAGDRYRLGSVAASVLDTAPCPVFMVRIQRPEPPRTRAEERWQGEGGANVG